MKELAYRTSYSHCGRYYTLDEVAEFDEQGLWSCREVWFSVYGTLLSTAAAMVEAADLGYFVYELDNLLHVGTKDALRKLVRDAHLTREKVAGQLLYCAADSRRRRQQLLARRALLAGMEEGVALWGSDGELLEANPAAEKLCGSLPRLGEIEAVLDPASGEGAVKRAGHELSLHTSPLEGGLLAIIRDVTAESELNRRRRDMQRLVSHELKTPLASISGFGETLERYELTGQEQRRVASLIRGEAGRLQEMVTVFLDLERLGAGHWEGDAEIVDFSELVRRRLEILAAAADARGQSFTPSLADGCRVSGVPALLDRVVDNLLGNAIKYSVDGDKIEVVVRSDDERIVFSVCDHGPGIPADEITRLSERFYRIAGAAESGSGLGLALVDEIATWHGGCIYIDSEIGSGSTFTVELPAVGED